MVLRRPVRKGNISVRTKEITVKPPKGYYVADSKRDVFGVLDPKTHKTKVGIILTKRHNVPKPPRRRKRTLRRKRR